MEVQIMSLQQSLLPAAHLWDRLSSRQWLALAVPPLLTTAMFVTFKAFLAWFGHPLGYLLAFAVYWVGWCLFVPALLLGGWRQLAGLFRTQAPNASATGWKTALLLLWPLAFPLFFRFLPQLREANLAILLASLLIGLVIGVTEEVLWRGVYVRLFRESLALSVLYPSIMFALWHLAPQAVHANQSPGGVASFVVYSLVLGLSYAIHARRTGSIRGATLSHCIHDSLGLGAFAYASWLT
jgi:membrane protease YdiL (CAAX protease family)